MKKEMNTIREAVQEWVRGFNAISQTLLVKAYKNDIDNIMELTKPTVGDNAWSNEYQDTYEIISINKEEETAIIEVDDEEKEVSLDDLSVEYDDFFPMWGTMWTFEETIDEEWARENLQTLSECGFRIYEDQEDGDIYIGIDGAGYDFYDSHWIPLYNARGLQWHK